MTIEYRLATAEDMNGYFAQAARAFHRQSPQGEIDHFSSTFDFARTRVAIDNNVIVGTLRSWPSEFTVAGPRTIPVSALTNVTVSATHRRQGILTSMIVGDLRDSAARGEFASILIASEYPIYGRYGYGAAIENAAYRIETTGLTYVAPSEGRVEICDISELRHDAPAIYERHRLSQPGAIERGNDWWDRFCRIVNFDGMEPHKGFCARYVAPDGSLEGYLVCEGKLVGPDMRHRGVLTVHELMSSSDRAYRALWKFCTDVDLLVEVTASNRAVEEPIGHLFTNARAVQQIHVHDFIWIRLLDVVAALEARTYDVFGTVVLDILDPLDIAQGCYELIVDADGASCKKTTQQPDIRMNISVLGAIYAGDTSLASLATAGEIELLNPAALALATSIFKTSTRSWCATWF